MLSTIQILLLLLVLFGLSRAYLRYREKTLPLVWMTSWAIFWIAVAGVVIRPELTTRVATRVGIGRGADLAVYLAIVVLYLLLFRISVSLGKIERTITKIVREIALKDRKDL